MSFDFNFHRQPKFKIKASTTIGEIIQALDQGLIDCMEFLFQMEMRQKAIKAWDRAIAASKH